MQPTRPQAHIAYGQALVEFVLVVPVLILLLLGLVCVGQFLLTNYTVTQAARAAAHQAALSGGDRQAAVATARMVLDAGVGTRADAGAIRVSCERSPCRRYDPITVEIAYRSGFWTPLPPLFTEFQVQATATRASERDQQ